ncbi:MAG TPA: hypothetical protein VIL48_13065 [Acidimicrobiales bacterium]
MPRTVTAEDVAWLNRRLLIRSAGFARTTGVGLVIVGVVGAVGWLWAAVRMQQDVGRTGNMIVDSFMPWGAMSGLERIDLLSGSVRDLLLSALTVGVGLALRLAADAAEDWAGTAPVTPVTAAARPGVPPAPASGIPPAPSDARVPPPPSDRGGAGSGGDADGATR